MKRFLSLLLSVIIIAGCLCMWSCDFNGTVNPENSKFVQMEFEGYGSIVIEIYHDAAPITAENFIRLVEDGFYDGLTIFRAQRNFVIQGGRDYNTKVDPIVGEFASNGHNNPLSHKRGVISMARTSDPDSASSGFFICDADSPHLDGQYASFGYVLSGMHTVDKIVSRSIRHTGDNGQISNKKRQPVIEYIKILEDYAAN